MLKFFKRIWMGAGYLEGYGHHPGTPVLLIFILAAGLAGIDKGGLDGFLGGAFVGFICLVPFYIIGCVERARGYEQDVVATMDRLKKDYNGN